MPKHVDKRRRSDLDVFILALIDNGISTPYELQKHAGLSQGATIPALQRLLEAGFLLHGRPGVRGRTDYRPSASGKRFLQDGWRSLIESGPTGDVDADLRVALLALLAGNREHAVEFLRASADKRLESIADSKSTHAADTGVPLAQWYRELRACKCKAVLAAEADAIRAIADGLPTNLGMKQEKQNILNKRQKGT